MLRDAQDHQEVMARDVAGKVQQVLGDELSEAGFKDIAGKAIHGDLKGALRDARGSAIGKWEAETHDITTDGKAKLTLTTPQIMELYLLSKRKQALGHLLGGGVIQPEIKSAETGRTKVPRGTQQVFLTDGDIERITGKLTDEQKRVADGLQGLTATTLANYGNEASMKAYGYRKFTERNYWPIKSAREGVHSNLEKDSGNVRSIKNIGMAQQVQQNANNAVELHSVFDTFADHASDMIDYWEKFFSAFTGVEGDEESAWEVIQNVVLNGNIGDNMNPIGQIPFAKDILSLAQGYDVSRPDMEVFADMLKAGQTFVDSAGGNGKKTRKEATLGLIAAASKMFGLPVSNIKRDLMATLRTIAQASGSLGFQYEVEKFSYNLANSGNRGRFIGILYDALEQGDYATYEHVRRELMEQMGLDGESIQSSLKTRYSKKTESEANYSFPQKSLDLLGIRGKYAYDSGEGEEKFSAADLNASSYSKYETQKGEAYRTQADKATSSGAFSRLSDEGKDKALGYVESYAKAVALKENSGGQYEITTKWIQNAQEAQKQYRIAPGVFAACKASAGECEMLKDKDGDSIDYSKGLQIMEMLFRSGLNEQQRTAMYGYLDVPKSIRHWNRARVDEQLAIMRKKAA